MNHNEDADAKPISRQVKKDFSPKDKPRFPPKPGFKGGAKGGAKDDKKREPRDVQDRTDGQRIAKVLARAGIASRREIERLISLGKIAVNGRILDKAAVLIKDTDIITVDGQVVGAPEATRVFRYHKPVGLLTTHNDPKGRATVFDSLPEPLPRVISVGRLDLNSEGLLLLTNDGELARALELPSTEWVRRYRARCLGHTTQAKLDELKNGVTVEGVNYGPMEAKLDKMAEKPDGRANVWISVAITEGKNREVRKVLESIGLKVNRLIRLAYGPFSLGDLALGAVEEVGPRVVRELLGDKILPRNLPSESASQPVFRAERGVEGRRGGGDRFAKSKPNSARPREYTPRAEGTERPKRDFSDRPKRDFLDRPKRDFGDKPREYTPRAEGTKRPKRDFGDRLKRDFSDRPKRDFGDRPDSSKPREYTPRAENAERPKRDFGDRPKRDIGDKPRTSSGFKGKPSEGRAFAGKPSGGGFKSGGFKGKPSGGRTKDGAPRGKPRT
jgi:23S rRNA pseudouridine2605 synthase